MKKLSLITLALLTLLLAQCKKEKIDNNSGTDVKKVKVRCEVPMGNSGKTDFSNLMEGKIKWSTGTERIYLVINGDNRQIIELSATTTVPGATSLYFEGEVPENVISTTKTYDVWYFGNSQNIGEGSYVSKTESDGVITQIDGSIATQSGKLSDLGYHHIAKGSAYFETIDEEVTLKIHNGKLVNQMAIAYMDLTDVTKLEGYAIVGTSYSLQYNEVTAQYDFIVSEGDKVINIANNTDPEQSYVVLMPNNPDFDADIEIISFDNKKRYYFRNGIEASKFYYSGANDEVRTLVWEEYTYIDGHEYVDLGLSVKWARYNIGVNPTALGRKTTEAGDYYGHYFMWSHVRDIRHEEEDNFSIPNTPNCIQGDLEHDAATVNWGGNWVMPTKTQMEELLNEENCDWVKVDNFNGIGLKGFKVISKKSGFEGRYIFLPAAGYYETSSWTGVFDFQKVPTNIGDRIYYWTADWHSWVGTGRPKAWLLKQDGSESSQSYLEPILYGDPCEDARSVRPVYNPTTNEE